MPATSQTDLLTYLAELPTPRPSPEGETFDPGVDGDRLRTLADRVWAVVRDGDWHTLAELADRCRGSEAGVSARLRDFRKIAWGSNRVERRRTDVGGVWEYRLVVLDTTP